MWQYPANNKLVLVEPYIEKFQKFNSNTGWTAKNENPWTKILQALSHFSYHASGGACVLCDLQGAVYDEFLVLTDPVIMSRTAEFGATDMGANGVHQLFLLFCACIPSFASYYCLLDNWNAFVLCSAAANCTLAVLLLARSRGLCGDMKVNHCCGDRRWFAWTPHST